MKVKQADRLVDVAEVILRKLNRPATAREIIDRALVLPSARIIFSGKTPHKTLNARISVDILRHGIKSRFYRYAPAAYGLREFLESKDNDHNYKRVFIGSSRRKQVSNEPVATVKCSAVKFFSVDGLYDADHYPLQILDLLDVKYSDRKYAECRDDLKQLVSYACIYYEDQVLAFEKGRYTSDDGEFIGKQSIGFGGHVSYFDLSLFDDTPVGLNSNVLRELYEELYFFRKYFRHGIKDIQFLGFLIDSSTANGKRHLGLATKVQLRHKIELETATLGFRNLRWISAQKTPNTFDQFEIWSQYLFRHLQSSSGAQS